MTKGGINMEDIRNSFELQKSFLEKNLSDINKIVSAYLGYRTNLRIVEVQAKNKYLELVDDNNINRLCGIMSNSFANVYLKSFFVNFSKKDINDIAFIELDFVYTQADGGYNMVKAMQIEIRNEFIKIIL